MLLSLIKISRSNLSTFWIIASLYSIVFNLYIILSYPSFYIGKISLNQLTYLPISTILIFAHFLYIILTQKKLKLISSSNNINFLLLFVCSTTIFSLLNFSNFTLWYFGGVIFLINLINSQINISKIQNAIWLLTFILSLIGISQFILQHDLNLQLIGENNLNLLHKGIAKFKPFLSENWIIRSYSLFPHPNIFAAFISLSILTTNLKIKHNLFQYLGILSSFSISGFLSTLPNLKVNKYLISSFLGLFVIILLIRNPILNSQNITERLTQFINIFHNPFALKPWEVQPIHNIFALSFLKFTPIHTALLIKLLKDIYKKSTPLFYTIFILGFFDHYILTNHSIFYLLILTIFMLFQNSEHSHSKNPLPTS